MFASGFSLELGNSCDKTRKEIYFQFLQYLVFPLKETSHKKKLKKLYYKIETCKILTTSLRTESVAITVPSNTKKVLLLIWLFFNNLIICLFEIDY